MRETLAPMLSSIFCTHICVAEIQCLDHNWRVICSRMANGLAESGGRGTLSETIRHASLTNETALVGQK